MKVIAALLIALALGACASKPAKPQVTTVYVKVKEPCIKSRPVKPVYQFGKGPMPSDKEAAAILTEDFEAAERYGNSWEAAAAGCVIDAPRAQSDN
jgi:hypothetical protein